MKKYSHSRHYGKRVMNWRVLVISVTVLFCSVTGAYVDHDNVYVADHYQDMFMKPVVVDHPEDESVETKIRKYFPRSHKTMIAIAKAESGLKPNAINYNCWYTQDGKISTTYVKNGGKACKVEDRKYSFGVDCFVLQAHYPGRKSCPVDVTIDEHLQEMAELSKKRSFQPWVAYNLKMHEKYLANK